MSMKNNVTQVTNKVITINSTYFSLPLGWVKINSFFKNNNKYFDALYQ